MFLGEVICPPWSFSGDVAWALESGRRSLVPSINRSTIYHDCFLMICGESRQDFGRNRVYYIMAFIIILP